MSLERLVFPLLGFAEVWHIVNFLDHDDLYRLGCTKRTAFVLFMRERILRAGHRERHRNTSNAESTRSSALVDDSRFLSTMSNHEKVLLVSYPRSGNSFLRKLLESRTGIATGSDSRPNRPLTSSLLRFGYKGEGITDQSVWIVKSHFPERMGYIRVPVARALLVVRNPIDALESYFHMAMTNTHDKMLTPESFNSLNEIWTAFVANETLIWREFHRYWKQLSKKIPVLIMRYEELLQTPEESMTLVESFLRQGATPIGRQRFGKSVLCDSAKSDGPAGYQPKNRKVGKSLSRMTVKQVRELLSVIGPLCEEFGYEFVDSAPADAVDAIASDHMSIVLKDMTRTEQLTEPGARFVANGSKDIRHEDDPFGRKVTLTRQRFTDQDRNPLPTL